MLHGLIDSIVFFKVFIVVFVQYHTTVPMKETALADLGIVTFIAKIGRKPVRNARVVNM